MVPDREDVEFTSRGAVLRGWLYRAEGGSVAPGVVMAHGMTAVREMFLDRFAEAFARAGFTTLVYDHFGFGASEGEPRQCPAPSIQLEGYRDAIAWLGAHPAVDAERIGIWGSSFSGGEVMVLAAEGLPLRAAVAQVPLFGDHAPDLPAPTLAAIGQAIEDGGDATIPAVTDRPDGLGLMFEDGAHEWFTRVAAERAPSWRNELVIRGILEPFRPIDHLIDATVPLLLVVAPDDTLTPPGSGIAWVAARAMDTDAETDVPIEVVEIPGGHFDAYEAGFEASAGAAIDWYRRHLAGGSITAR